MNITAEPPSSTFDLSKLTPLGNEVRERLQQRIEALADISESTDGLMRRFATPEHRRANTLAAEWMRDAGMRVWEDAMGNLIGRYPADDTTSPAILIGSHLDTVIMAGRFDGMLGVLSGIAVVESLQQEQRQLPVAIEVVAFADEEGVRYQSTYLGSKAITGSFDMTDLERVDKDGISMADALRQFGQDPSQLPAASRSSNDFLAYLEVHIEQGPVLETENEPVGIVTGIAGATRMRVTLHGVAGHAGTVPMRLRHDAMSAAAAGIVAIEGLCMEAENLVGTVGELSVSPGASNVIAGEVSFSIDLRSPQDARRLNAVAAVTAAIREAASERGVEATIETVHDENSVDCSSVLADLAATAIESCAGRPLRIASGAGHDAAEMAKLTPTGMLFVRCLGGVSHNPAEYVTPEDMLAGVEALRRWTLLAAHTDIPFDHNESADSKKARP